MNERLKKLYRKYFPDKNERGHIDKFFASALDEEELSEDESDNGVKKENLNQEMDPDADLMNDSTTVSTNHPDSVMITMVLAVDAPPLYVLR